MSKLDFGTIRQDGDLICHNVAYALDRGYDLIDIANRYGNEIANATLNSSSNYYFIIFT